MMGLRDGNISVRFTWNLYLFGVKYFCFFKALVLLKQYNQVKSQIKLNEYVQIQRIFKFANQNAYVKIQFLMAAIHNSKL